VQLLALCARIATELQISRCGATPGRPPEARFGGRRDLRRHFFHRLGLALR